jgi:hypothetical protein
MDGGDGRDCQASGFQRRLGRQEEPIGAVFGIDAVRDDGDEDAQ